MSFDFICSRDRILLDVPYQIWEAQSADGGLNVFLTRLFHNKLLFYGSNFFRCYLSYFSPDFIARVFTIFGLIFFLLGVWYLISRKKRFLAILFLLVPLSPLFQIPDTVSVQAGILFSGFGLVMIFGLVSAVKSVLALRN